MTVVDFDLNSLVPYMRPQPDGSVVVARPGEPEPHPSSLRRLTLEVVIPARDEAALVGELQGILATQDDITIEGFRSHNEPGDD